MLCLQYILLSFNQPLNVFSGLCYAEFAARVPKAGSAYVYSYVSVGEFIAFTIGWNLILEYVIGTASVAKGMANYIDSLCNNTMANTMASIAPMKIPYMADYPDFFAFGLVLLIASKSSVLTAKLDRPNRQILLSTMATVTKATSVLAQITRCWIQIPLSAIGS